MFSSQLSDIQTKDRVETKRKEYTDNVLPRQQGAITSIVKSKTEKVELCKVKDWTDVGPLLERLATSAGDIQVQFPKGTDGKISDDQRKIKDFLRDLHNKSGAQIAQGLRDRLSKELDKSESKLCEFYFESVTPDKNAALDSLVPQYLSTITEKLTVTDIISIPVSGNPSHSLALVKSLTSSSSQRPLVFEVYCGDQPDSMEATKRLVEVAKAMDAEFKELWKSQPLDEASVWIKSSTGPVLLDSVSIGKPVRSDEEIAVRQAKEFVSEYKKKAAEIDDGLLARLKKAFAASKEAFRPEQPSAIEPSEGITLSGLKLPPPTTSPAPLPVPES